MNNADRLKDYLYYQDDAGEIYCGDCLEIMPLLADKSIDLVLTDPPYGVTRNEWDIPPNLNSLWIALQEKGKDNTAYILTATQPFTTDLINSNRTRFRYDLIYEKTLGSGFLNAPRMPMRYHEEVLVFYEKLPTYNPIMGQGVRKRGVNRSLSNGTNYGKKTKFDYKYDDNGERCPRSIITISTGDRTREQYHPTGKPVELMMYLIQTYSNETDLILDPFLGSGTTAVACKRLNRRFIGIEISEKYCQIARDRLANEVEPLFKGVVK